MKQLSLPPILQTPGLKLVGLREEEGHQYLVFRTSNRRNKPIVVVVRVFAPGEFIYIYTVTDRRTKTIITYQGPHGDPLRDEADPIGVEMDDYLG